MGGFGVGGRDVSGYLYLYHELGGGFGDIYGQDALGVGCCSYHSTSSRSYAFLSDDCLLEVYFEAPKNCLFERREIEPRIYRDKEDEVHMNFPTQSRIRGRLSNSRSSISVGETSDPRAGPCISFIYNRASI